MILILFLLVFAVIYWNIAPFIYADTFGHYLRPRRKHYVHSEKDNHGNMTIYNDIVEMETIKEKCNPWLMWWHLVKIKPAIIEWEFDSEETKKIWDKMK